MKKTKETKIRRKMPNRLRFSRLFLRRMLVLFLAAAVCDLIFLHKTYSDEIARNGRVILDDACRKFFEVTDESGTSVSEAEACLNQYGLKETAQQFDMAITTVIWEETQKIDPFMDTSIMLMDPENGTYAISAPEVRLTLSVPNQNSDEFYDDKYVYAEKEEAEEIAAHVREFGRAKYLRDYIQVLSYAETDPVLNKINAHISNFQMWDSRIIPFQAYYYGDSFRSLEYGYEIGGKLCETFRRDAVVSGAWKHVELPVYYPLISISDNYDKYRVQCQEWREQHPDSPQLSRYSLRSTGSPASTPAGQTMQQVAEAMDKNLKSEIRSYQDYKELSAKGRTATVYEYDTLSGWMNPEPTERLLTSEDLELMLERIQGLPGTFCSALKDSPFSKAVNGKFEYTICSTYFRYEMMGEYAENGVRYYADIRTVEIGGKPYSLFVCLNREPMKKCLPIAAVLGIQMLFCALLLSLFWTAVVYLRERKQYEMDEYRRTLTAALAHDLKSPLTAISGYAENLCSGVHPEKQLHYSESILQNTQYMDNIITNVLDLAQLEKSSKARKKRVNPIALMQEAAAHRQEDLAVRALHTEITGSCSFRADPLMMTQAIRNLLDNAVKFTPEGGSITVTGEGSTLRIVNDIAEDKVEHVETLCEAFVKGDSARSNRRGTGLGLSVVRQIAELNRLQFSIESSDHKFIVLLRGRPMFFRRKHVSPAARNRSASGGIRRKKKKDK